jgi:DNA-binding HxlR family transcriptional regulator
MKPTQDTVCVDTLRRIMDIFGGKWTYIIMGELHAGPQKFNQLNRNVGCSTKSLSDALKKLEQNGIISRKILPASPITVEYSLTEKGYDFQNVFFEMKRWGAKWLTE